MKVIGVIVIVLLGIFFTQALEANDEDINSPLVSYLLAKIQRLELKLSVNGNIRSSRQVEQKRSVVANETAVKNKDGTEKCSPNAVTYIRWGNSTCEYGADTMYSGFVVVVITVTRDHLLICCAFPQIHSTTVVRLMVTNTSMEWNIK